MSPLPASDMRSIKYLVMQTKKKKHSAHRSTQNVYGSYLRRCLKRACMVSWLGLGSCQTSSLVDWTRCLWSGFSAGDRQESESAG